MNGREGESAKAFLIPSYGGLMLDCLVIVSSQVFQNLSTKLGLQRDYGDLPEGKNDKKYWGGLSP